MQNIGTNRWAISEILSCNQTNGRNNRTKFMGLFGLCDLIKTISAQETQDKIFPTKKTVFLKQLLPFN